MNKLTTSEIQKLRAQAHQLKPIVMISEKGLADSVLKEIDKSLKAHELLKIRIFVGDRVERENIAEEICKKVDAIRVQLIGKILIIYRHNPEAAAKPDTAKLNTVSAKKSSSKRPPTKQVRKAVH